MYFKNTGGNNCHKYTGHVAVSEVLLEQWIKLKIGNNVFLLPHLTAIKMDYEPPVRRSKKDKGKKGPYSTKHIRISEAIKKSGFSIVQVQYFNTNSKGNVTSSAKVE